MDIAKHIRIFDLNPEDDLAKKREAAIKDLASRYGKGGREVTAIFKTASCLAHATVSGGQLDAETAKEIETSIKKSAKAFVGEGQELQMTVCGLLAAMHVLTTAQPSSKSVTVADVLAVGLWAALSFQVPLVEPRIEALRIELLGVAREYTHKTASTGRKRLVVPDPVATELKEMTAASVGEAIGSALQPSIQALRSNAALDREEIDFLWWTLADHSALLNQTFSSAANPVSAALASGIEAGKMLRRMPADAHQHLALRHVTEGEPLNLTELLEKLDQDRTILAAAFVSNASLSASPTVFPLLTALVSGAAQGDGHQVARSLRDWASRALLETAALHITSHLPSAAI